MTSSTTYRHVALECPRCKTETTNFPGHLLRCPDKPITDERIHDAIDRLIQQGEHYLKSRDVVQELGKDDTNVSQGKLTHIGQILSDRDDMDRWGKGRRSITWQVVEA